MRVPTLFLSLILVCPAISACSGGEADVEHSDTYDTDPTDTGPALADCSELPKVIQRSTQVPSVAWSGNVLGLAYSSGTGTYSTNVVTLDAEGNPIAGPTTLRFGDRGAAFPAIAWSGDSFGVAYFTQDSGGIQLEFEFVNEDSTSASDAFEVGPGPFVVLYAPHIEGGAGGFAVSSSSTGLDYVTGGGSIRPNRQVDDASPGMAWNGADFGVSFEKEGRRPGFLRMNTDGGGSAQVELSFPRIIDSRLAWNGEAYGLLWLAEELDGSEQVNFVMLDTAGTAITSVVQLTNTGTDKVELDVASDGDGFAVVWREDEGEDQAQIWFALMDGDGERASPNTAISTSGTTRWGVSVLHAEGAYSAFWQGDGFSTVMARGMEGCWE